MKRLLSLCMTVVALGALTGCPAPVDNNPNPTPDAGTDAGTNPQTGERIEVKGAITADTTWKAENTYVLTEHIFVEGGTLTIEPGTQVLGKQGSSLVITRDAKINAVGTKEKPIVFTSSEAAGQRLSGDWGGVVLLGRARLNVEGGESFIEGFAAGSDERTKYGGTDDAHDCGSLKYARIEFAGFKLINNSELNGLTVGGCGSNTELDYVQVHRGTDDGIEFFGGTTNLKHAIVSLTEDDGVDWDFGFSGKIQFLVVQQGGEIGNNGFESDSNEAEHNAEPRSAPQIWNATLIGRTAGGPEKSIGMTLRRGTAGKLNNFILQGFSAGAVDINNVATAEQYEQGNLALKSFIFWANKGPSNAEFAPMPNASSDGTNPDTTNFNEWTRLMESTNGNQAVDPMLTDATNLTAPNFMPKAGSPALNADKVTPIPSGDSFFTPAPFIGAVGADDWTAGWTAYPEA